jgi:hypothetical protein
MVNRLLLEDLGYLSLLGGAGTNTASTPDHADFAITGDIDVRILIAANDWTPASVGGELVMSQTDGATQKAWWFYLNQDTGTLVFNWSENGSANKTAQSTVAPTVSDGSPLWVRATLDVDNGASGRDVKFYTSAEPISTAPASVTWTQLGTTVTTATVTSIFNSNASVTFGGLVGLFNGLTGKVYYAEVRNGIAGTVVTDPDFRDADQQNSATQLTDDFSKVWTVNGTATWPLPSNVASYLLEDGSGILLLESSVPDIPYTNPMPLFIAQ